MVKELGMIPYCHHYVPSSKLVRFLFVMSHIAFNYLVYNKTSIRKIQTVYTRKIESSQPITEYPQLEVSRSWEVIFWLDAKSLSFLNLSILICHCFSYIQCFIVQQE